MNRFHKTGTVLLTALAMLLSAPGQAAAATKPISSVSVKVSSKLEAGSALPDIEIGSGTVSEGSVRVSAGNSRYSVSEAEWVDHSDKALKAADEPRMKVTLEPEDVSEAYFLASYKESNVSISGGSFVSAKRDGDSLVVTLRLKGIRGDYDPPRDAFWHEDNLGEARWEKPENVSGYYEVQLYRDGKSVYKVPKISAVRYNFYPYMTKEGLYSFKVRSIPGTKEQEKYGGKSEWIESGDLDITERYVSDGKGQQKQDSTVKRGTADTVGWIQDGENWSYRFPDGNLCRGGWEIIDGLWYYFDVDGRMLTGWQQVGGSWYYLYPNGQMAVGWARIDGRWYYFHNGQDDADRPQGSMIDPGWQVIGANYYYFNTDGSMYTGWLSQNGSWYYLNELDNRLQGAMFTGWITRDNKTYFTDSNGVRVEGWCEIDGNWRYFYPGTGEMAVDTEIQGFYVNQDGIWKR